MRQLITIADLCAAYRVSRSTAYREIAAGRLPVFKIGRATRIRREAAEAWAAALENQAA
jgi:excisionase family DNA binding protein